MQKKTLGIDQIENPRDFQDKVFLVKNCTEIREF